VAGGLPPHHYHYLPSHHLHPGGPPSAAGTTAAAGTSVASSGVSRGVSMLSYAAGGSTAPTPLPLPYVSPLIAAPSVLLPGGGGGGGGGDGVMQRRPATADLNPLSALNTPAWTSVPMPYMVASSAMMQHLMAGGDVPAAMSSVAAAGYGGMPRGMPMSAVTSAALPLHYASPHMLPWMVGGTPPDAHGGVSAGLPAYRVLPSPASGGAGGGGGGGGSGAMHILGMPMPGMLPRHHGGGVHPTPDAYAAAVAAAFTSGGGLPYGLPPGYYGMLAEARGGGAPPGAQGVNATATTAAAAAAAAAAYAPLMGHAPLPVGSLLPPLPPIAANGGIAPPPPPAAYGGNGLSPMAALAHAGGGGGSSAGGLSSLVAAARHFRSMGGAGMGATPTGSAACSPTAAASALGKRGRASAGMSVCVPDEAGGDAAGDGGEAAPVHSTPQYAAMVAACANSAVAAAQAAAAAAAAAAVRPRRVRPPSTMPTAAARKRAAAEAAVGAALDVTDPASAATAAAAVSAVANGPRPGRTQGRFGATPWLPGRSKYSPIYHNDHAWAVVIRNSKVRFKALAEAEAYYEQYCISRGIRVADRVRPGFSPELHAAALHRLATARQAAMHNQLFGHSRFAQTPGFNEGVAAAAITADYLASTTKGGDDDAADAVAAGGAGSTAPTSDADDSGSEPERDADDDRDRDGDGGDGGEGGRAACAGSASRATCAGSASGAGSASNTGGASGVPASDTHALPTGGSDADSVAL